MKTCVFAGTFDPFTVGHKAVVDKILNSGRRVIITVGDNPSKTPYFTQAERAEIIRAAYKGNRRVRVIVYSELKENYLKLLSSLNVTEYYRGIRNNSDYEFERANERENEKLYPNVKTFYIFSPKFSGVSSSFVKAKLQGGKDVKKYIPKRAYKTLKKFLYKKQGGK